nr:hypothetical protein [uncultured Mucilaginibacter sp.]
MKTIKMLFIALVVAAVASSCGIFKKDCNCPHFGMKKTEPKVYNV